MRRREEEQIPHGGLWGLQEDRVGESALCRDPLPAVRPGALQYEVLEQSEHLGLAPSGPDGLRVTELHLQQLGGSEDGGELVSGLEQLPTRHDLGQKTPVRPDVGWRPWRWRLQRTVVVDGAVAVVPPPILDYPLLHPLTGLLQVPQPLVLCWRSCVTAQPRAALRPVRALLECGSHIS